MKIENTNKKKINKWMSSSNKNKPWDWSIDFKKKIKEN